MAFFRRARRKDSEPTTTRALDEDQVRTVAALARTAFAECGTETTYDGDGALVGDGIRYGLYNLCAVCATVPAVRWPQIIRQHAATMTSIPDESDPQSLEEVRDRLFLRVVSPADLPFGPPEHALYLAPDLCAIAAIDHPTHVSMLGSDDALGALGGPEVVREVGLANLRRLRAADVSAVRADPERSDSQLHVLEGDFFGASRLLVLDDVLRDEIGVERPRHGVLVAVPNRHLLVVHVLEGLGTLAAMNAMVRVAHAEHDGAGAVSPHVYHAKDGRLQQVTQIQHDGSTAVEVRDALAEAFAGIGLPGGPGG